MRSTGKLIPQMIAASLLLGLGCSSSSEPEPEPPPPAPEPGLNWTAPGELGNIVQPPVELTVTTDEGMGAVGVSFYLDGDLLATDNDPPYTVNWTPQGVDSVGIHQAVATAFGSGGAEIVSDTLQLMIADTAGPGTGFGGGRYDRTGAMVLTDDSRTLICGSLTLPGQVGEEGSLICDDGATGNRWFRTFGPGAFRSLQSTDDGGVVLAGWTLQGLDRDGPNQWLMQLDEEGAIVWSSVAGIAAAWEYLHCITPCAGGWIATGRRGDGDTARLIVKKIDSEGNELWQRDDYSALSSTGYAIAESDDGGFIVTGVKEIASGGDTSTEKGWLLKLSGTGAVQWESLFALPATAFSVGRAVLPTTSGYMVAGQSGNDLCLLKSDTGGGQVWLESFGIGLARDLIQDGADFVATGYTQASGNAVRQLTLLAVNGSGAELWRGGITDGTPSEGVSLAATTTGFRVTGMVDSENDGDSDILLLETGPQGAPLN